MNLRTRLEHDFVKTLRDERLVRPGERVLIALSGGADSVALLHLFLSTTPHFDLRLTAAHLDHGIRWESGHDAEFAASLCRRLDIPLLHERRDVPLLARQLGVGLEEAGRLARRAFLEECADRADCAVIALGHHRGDQAETVVHHLARGCAVTGLAAMRPRTGRYIRPLLEFPREVLRYYLAELGEGFVEDESNNDLAFTRNRIRHELLLALAALNPRIEEALATLARCAAREEDYWAGEVERLAHELAAPAADGWQLAVPALSSLHPAQRTRLLRYLLMNIAARSGKEIVSQHIEAVEELLISPVPQRERDLPGVWAARRYDRLFLRPHRPPPAAAWEVAIAAPGYHILPDGSLLHVALIPEARGETCDAVEFDTTSVILPLTARTLRAGDRIRLPGVDGRKKVKELLMEHRIPVEERRRMVAVEQGGDMLWIAGLRRCAGHAPSVGKAVLRLVRERPESPEMA